MKKFMSFDGMHWRDITFAHIEQYPDAVFLFSPEAFCSYLPGILLAGLKENRWDSNAYDALIGMLDRSPEPAYWDDFFLPRWRQFSDPEIEAVKSWIRWLESVQPDAFLPNSFEWLRDTLTLLQTLRNWNWRRFGP